MYGTAICRAGFHVASAGAFALAFASASMLQEGRAQACGGFFCGGPTQPVVQTKEGIIFAVDHTNHTVTAIINIAYQGSATEFAWLLPLQKEPNKIDVGARQAFAIADQLTAPRFFFNKVDTDGMCDQRGVLLANAEDSAAGGFSSPPPQAKSPGVEVLDQEEVGPYESVTLRGTDVEAVRNWLVANHYAVTDEMMQTVVPYIAQGDVLLALKLQKGADVGEIQPVSIQMPDTTEACIPIRLTAIAAQDDMDITAMVLSDSGRAIPKNYFHVTLNMAKIDWMNGGSNYRQIVGQAADEGMGNAFTTEYAGPSSVMKDQIYRDGTYDLAALRRTTRLTEFLQAVQNQGWQRRPEMRAILVKYIPELANCGSCDPGSLQDRDFDPTALVAEIEERVVKPEQNAQDLFDRYSYLTRLYTLISPEEMTLDPLFDYDATLPDISNQHTARLLLHCGLGGTPGSHGFEVILDDGTTIAFPNNTNMPPDRSVLDAMPAASRIEQLATHSLVVDNSDKIAELLGEHNSKVGGCGCDSASENARGGVAGAALGFALFLGLVLRRRA